MFYGPSQWLARVYIPYPRGFVERPGDHSATVWAERRERDLRLKLKPSGEANREATQSQSGEHSCRRDLLAGILPQSTCQISQRSRIVTRSKQFFGPLALQPVQGLKQPRFPCHCFL